MNYISNSAIKNIMIPVKRPSGAISLDQIMDEVMFFLGAGASVPAGITGVQGMVDEFVSHIKKEYDEAYVEVVREIIKILKQWQNNKIRNGEVDIELLLETTEKLENRQQDVTHLFYSEGNTILNKFENLQRNGRGIRLSHVLKQSIKKITGKSDIYVGYLNGLLKFMSSYKPLDIFSTNYDACIERFCALNKKTYFDGFEGEWEPDKFKNRNKDVRLYKLHGSITWSRSERGKYTRNEIALEDTVNLQTNIITGENEVPLILYPGRKLEYIEPVFDVLVELKNHLNFAKYIFVVGYEFRDDHIRKLFLYAARKKPDSKIFLITPNAHNIYYSKLKRYEDTDFIHSFTNESFSSVSFNTDVPSDLIGRVICLPYKFEKIAELLNDHYLDNLKKGQECEEEIEREYNMAPVKSSVTNRWHQCLPSYIECEFIDRVEKIVDEKVGWDNLIMNIDYRLGCKIILKSLLNRLSIEAERRKWLERLRNYIPITLENFELLIENDKVYIWFRLPGQSPLYGDDALNFYSSLLSMYEGHPIFFNDNVTEIKENGKERITKICEYLQIWSNTTIHLDHYIDLRKPKYTDKLVSIEDALQNYINNGSTTDLDNLKKTLNEIEQEELQANLE